MGKNIYTQDKITNFTPSPNKTSFQHAENLMAETLRCGNIYEEEGFNDFLF